MKEEYVGWLDDEWYVVLDHSQPIVRCRDCDFSHEDGQGNLRCHGPLTEPWDYYNDEPSDGVKVKPGGYCAWSERRGDA